VRIHRFEDVIVQKEPASFVSAEQFFVTWSSPFRSSAWTTLGIGGRITAASTASASKPNEIEITLLFETGLRNIFHSP
jgi:hypothetical protein